MSNSCILRSVIWLYNAYTDTPHICIQSFWSLVPKYTEWPVILINWYATPEMHLCRKLQFWSYTVFFQQLLSITGLFQAALSLLQHSLQLLSRFLKPPPQAVIGLFPPPPLPNLLQQSLGGQKEGGANAANVITLFVLLQANEQKDTLIITINISCSCHLINIIRVIVTAVLLQCVRMYVQYACTAKCWYPQY